MPFLSLQPRHTKVNEELKVSAKLSKHCLGTLVTKKPDKLFDGEACLRHVQTVLAKNNVVCLGQQLHEFPNNSFTLLIALSESHISIHTWPERLAVQLDVFLCNYMNDNTAKCENIYEGIVKYFEPVETNSTFLDRL